MGAENIYNRLMAEIGNPYGVAGAMGNIEAESGLRSNNLQNSVEKRLGMTDEAYTAAVDNGSYTDFCTDRGGYGLCQWTSAGRKTGLLNFARSRGVSIGNEDMQIEWLLQELRIAYKGVLSTLKTAKSVKEASDAFMCKFERPANQSEKNKEARAARGEKYYEMYAGKETAMNSPLVVYTQISPNRTSPRNHKIDTITIHCMACDLSVERCGAGFAKLTRRASSNYGVDSEGRIGLYVEEKDRSWCSSNRANDHRAVTIEVACEPAHPYKVTDAAMAALINLLEDICRRNDIKQLLWKGDKSLIGQVDRQNMTVHRWFAKKACPGDYLYGKHAYIASEVNKRLGVEAEQQAPVQQPSAAVVPYKVRITAGTLNVRAGAGTGYKITTTVKKGGIYTITAEQNGWGRLKSGAGWISLKYTEKL